MLTLDRPALTAAATGGVLWTVKSAVITARDGGFDPFESVFFLGGLVAIVAACVLVARCATRRLQGAGRVAATAGVAVGLVLLTGLCETLGKGLIGGPYDGGNVGIEEESGILLAGLFWLSIAGAAVGARRAHPARA